MFMKIKNLIKITSLLLVAVMLFTACGTKTETTSDFKFKKTLADGYPVKDCDNAAEYGLLALQSATSASPS